MLLFILGINFSNTIFSSNFILFCNKEGRSARTYGVIKQTRSGRKKYREENVFNSKKLNGDTHTSTRREREEEREKREREREREISQN